MITGVDNVSIIASNTPTEILSSTILGNDKNLGTGVKLIAVELFLQAIALVCIFSHIDTVSVKIRTQKEIR